jgi:hypothetical protein
MALMCFAAFSTPCLNNESPAKLIWGKELYIDASHPWMRMSPSIRLSTRFAVEARQAFQKHLEELFQAKDDEPPTVADPRSPQADSQPRTLPFVISEKEREELHAQQVTCHDWYAKGGRATT